VEHTSVESWHKLLASPNLGKQQRDCAEAFVALKGKAAAFEAEEWWYRKTRGLIHGRQVMGKRISELLRGGVLRKLAEKRYNDLTERLVNVYELTGFIPDTPLRFPAQGTQHTHDPKQCAECHELWLEGRDPQGRLF
jgi:hypothetical protein